MSIYKIECPDDASAKLIDSIIDDCCVVEGSAIVTDHQFTALEVELIDGLYSTTTDNLTETDLQEWARMQ